MLSSAKIKEGLILYSKNLIGQKYEKYLIKKVTKTEIFGFQ